MGRDLLIGVIGGGCRAGDLVRFRQPEFDVDVKISAIADVDADNAGRFKDKFGHPCTVIYSDFRQMLEREKLDGVVIATPNNVHVEQAIPVMELGIPLLLEKPIATTLDDCNRLLEVHKRTKSRVTVGFVLRYTPFYSKVKEIIDSGVIGNVMNVNAEELLARGLTQVFFRGWRKSYKISGGLLIEKCCHDLDILNWLVGDTPQFVASLGSSTNEFGPRPGTGAQCRDCSMSDTCDYNYWFFHNKYFSDGTSIDDTVEGRHIKYAMSNIDNCVYGSDSDLGIESQSVSIRYRNGVPAQFMVVMAQEWSHRRIHVLGSKGRVFGDPEDNRISIFTGCHDHETDHEEVIEVHPDDSGHHGGDSVIAGEFIRSILDPSFHPLASIEEGYRSVLLGLAAETSRFDQCVVELKEENAGCGETIIRCAK
ncbi:MAG: Gfo/Idh/MocA family protein [Armatimonadota bacterium]